MISLIYNAGETGDTNRVKACLLQKMFWEIRKLIKSPGIKERDSDLHNVADVCLQKRPP